MQPGMYLSVQTFLFSSQKRRMCIIRSGGLLRKNLECNLGIA